MACVEGRARAYASSANLGPGFDVLAVALDAFYDEVYVEVCDAGGEAVAVVESVEGPYSAGIDLDGNTARLAVNALLEGERVGGVRAGISIYKSIPPGRGLGSSGASAAASVVAAARALGLNPSPHRLIGYAGLGESVSAGSPHYDNVAASLLGGLVVVAVRGREVLAAYRAPLDGAWFAIVVPMVEVPPSKTGFMRSVLPGTIPLGEAAANFGRSAALVAAAHHGDLEAMGRLMMSDDIVEPARSKFTPCYSEVKKAALESGALGFYLSGAGPAMVALARGRESAERIASSMREACSCCGDAIALPSSPAPGALEVEVV
ncbi:MAG: homoserine kinase [Aeropyrum sp.]|nr:homoserine kinase [Aeropyrum sp.]MCE4616407.1 homoserine kinase [Aeropyrum sp.]